MCKCDCGSERIVSCTSLRLGITTRCIKCTLKKMSETCIARYTQHGMANTGVYKSWKNMRNRCFNPQHKQYKRYGALGRIPCVFIAESAINLKSLIGNKPDGKTLERPNNVNGYTCGTCKQCVDNGWLLNVAWATPKEQAQNRSRHKSIWERRWPLAFTRK